MFEPFARVITENAAEQRNIEFVVTAFFIPTPSSLVTEKNRKIWNTACSKFDYLNAEFIENECYKVIIVYE